MSARTRRVPRTRKRTGRKGRQGIDFRGRELRIPPMPTEFTSRPWWPLVVRLENSGTSLGLASLGANLRTQLGFAADVPVAFKLKSVRVWGPLVSFVGTGPLAPLSVAILDPFGQNAQNSGTATTATRVLEQFTRYPDQVNRACIGYEYSIAQQNLALSLQGIPVGSDLSLLQLTGAGAGTVIYFYVLWRSGTVSPSAFEELDDGSEEPIVSDDDSDVVVIRERTVRRQSKRA